MLAARFSSFVILKSVLLFSFLTLLFPRIKKKKKGTDHFFWVFGPNQRQNNTEFLYCWEFLNKYSRHVFQIPQDGSIVRCQGVLIFGWKNLVTMYRRSFITSYCNYFFRNLFFPPDKGLQDKSHDMFIF